MPALELDPRVKGLHNGLKYGGLMVVAVIASGIVIVSSGSVIVAGIAAITAIVTVNFIPFFARWAALKKQQGLTKLAEEFSEETIREDERQEGDRITILEDSYTNTRAELEGSIEEFQSYLVNADENAKVLIQSRIDELQGVISSAEETLQQRKQDFKELKQANNLLIAFHRSALAMEKAQGAARNPEELQRLETARTAIKTRMRRAMAGKTIEQMNIQFQQKPDILKIAKITPSSSNKTIPVAEKAGAQQWNSVSLPVFLYWYVFW